MTTQPNARAVRRACRAVALVPAALVLAAAGPALADCPESWTDVEQSSQVWALVFVGAAALALFAIIAVLVYLPSMVRGEKYTPGLAWRNENEWFGGPRGGVDAADKADPAVSDDDHQRGGASARW